MELNDYRAAYDEFRQKFTDDCERDLSAIDMRVERCKQESNQRIQAYYNGITVNYEDVTNAAALAEAQRRNQRDIAEYEGAAERQRAAIIENHKQNRFKLDLWARKTPLWETLLGPLD